MAEDYPEIKGLIITISGFVIIVWVAITMFQWFIVVNYDPCSAPTWEHAPSWCYFNSRYSLVETIVNQWEWIASLRII